MPWLWAASGGLFLAWLILTIRNRRNKKLQIHSPVPQKTPKSNIELIEIKNIEGAFGGTVYGVPIHGPLPTAVACLRNMPVKGQTPKQPQVNAHIIYRDSKRNEIGSLSHGVWIEEREDHVTLAVGETKCLVLLVRTKEGKLSMVWQGSYYHQNSWMNGGLPSFCVRDAELSRDPSRIVIELLDHWKGTRIKRFVLRATKNTDGLPTLKIQSAFCSFLRRD